MEREQRCLSRRVVVTGVGIVSPLGLDVPAFRQALAQRRCGVRRFTDFDCAGLPMHIAATVEGFDVRQYLEKKDRKSLKMMARTVQLAVAAARQAREDAQLGADAIDPVRLGVTLGVGVFPGEVWDDGPAAYASRDPETGEHDLRRWGSESLTLLQPMWMLHHVPNMASSHVSILHNAQGPNNSIVQTDVGGLLALREAVHVIQRDAADVMLAGGADTRTRIVAMIRYPMFAQVSRRNEEPEKACRPFDRQRDGMVLGEGAGVFVVEELEHARRRGARIYAEVIGSASAFDRGRTGQGLARCVGLAMSRAGVTAAEVDHVNAHAPGTTLDDVWEAKGLANLGVPVLALKGYLGHLGAAGNAVELAASVLALRDGERPGTLNHEETDPECPVNVLREPGVVQRPCVVKTAGTDQGQCAAVVLRRWEG